MPKPPRQHWLRNAFFDGLRSVDTDEMLHAIAAHTTLKGEWLTGVISPSLVATECRLARLKKFLGDGPQPGMKWLAVRGGHPDPITQLNFIRGFTMEGMVVTALANSVGMDRIMGHAPTLVFQWRYRGDDLKLGMWNQGMIFAGHPDMMIWNDSTELELVQIKSPSIFKLERVARYGDEDALRSYRSQMATEMYIGRRIGYPIHRSHLMMVSWEGTPKNDDPHCRVVTMEWDESMAQIPEQIARELIEDYDRAYTMGQWPMPYPEHRASEWPCSYCQFSRRGGFDTIGCTEQQEWVRFEESGETRLTVPLPDPTDSRIVQIRRRGRSA